MAVREALLHLLEEGERYGYQLKAEFEARTGGIWPLNVGQVYTTLDRLERDGLVATAGAASTPAGGDQGQRTYRITDDGRLAGKQWLSEGPDAGPPPRDELLMKVLLAAGRSPHDAVAVIADQRRLLLGLLQAARHAQRARAGAPLAERLAHDALLTRTEADLAWLERCEALVVAEASAAPTTPANPPTTPPRSRRPGRSRR